MSLGLFRGLYCNDLKEEPWKTVARQKASLTHNLNKAKEMNTNMNPPSAIESRLRAMAEDQHKLHAAVSHLNTRLQSVLSPVEKQTVTQPTPVDPACCPLDDRLFDLHRGIVSATEALRGLVEQLKI